MLAFRSLVSVLVRRWETFLYTLKAGPAGGRLRRPSSAGRPPPAARLPSMNAARKQQFAHIEAAKSQLQAWTQANDVPLVHVDFVVPFVETDFTLSVWLFYDTDRNVADLDRDGTTARMQQEFLSLLGADGYPAAWLPEITFSVDSYENVQRNYQGSYLYRLR